MIDQNIEISRLTEHDLKDFQQLIVLFMDIFEHDDDTIPRELYLKRLLERTDFVAFAVKIDGKLAGGLTAYELRKYYSEESEMFIYDIAVQPELQRQGLGKQLLSALKEYCRENSISDIFVAAFEEEQQAVDFYHSTGGDAEKVFHFNYSSAREKP